MPPLRGKKKPQRGGKRENKEAARERIPDLAAVAWQGRAVFVVFDSDGAEKKTVYSTANSSRIALIRGKRTLP
jgi:hypothetical protein